MSETDSSMIDELAANTFRQAQRVVAAQSTDAHDCRMLLSMLGIPEHQVPHQRTEIISDRSR